MKFPCQVDDIATVILTDLIQANEKVKKREKSEKQWRMTTLVTFTTFLIAFLFNSVLHDWPDVVKMTEALLTNQINLVFLIVTIGSYGFLQMKMKKLDKAETDFDQLRRELVRRSEEFWPFPNKLDDKQKVYAWMKQQYGINLYYEND